MSGSTQNSSLGIVQPKTARFDQPLKLARGGQLDSYDLVYETYGSLNSNASNAILICHALSSNHHAAGYYEQNKKSAGWWNALIGLGKPINTDNFFVVCCNNLGGCGGSTGPSSTNPATGNPYGPDFPEISVKDWVAAQLRLAERLKIPSWAAIIGGSLGGMQALEWSITHPKHVKHVIVIASAAKLSAQNIGFNDVARQAICTDPDFHQGNYYQHRVTPARGLRIARMLGHMTYLSDGLMATKFGRKLRKKNSLDDQQSPEFEVESYLRYQGEQFVSKFDANTYLLMTKALDYFDPAAECDGCLAKAFEPATAKFLVISFSSDWRFAPERSKEIVRALYSNDLDVSYSEVEAAHGHDSFLLEIPDYFNVLTAYMARVEASCG